MPTNLRSANGLPVNSIDNGNGSADLCLSESYALGTTQALVFSGSATASSAFGTAGLTQQIRIVATADCYISVGASPTASSATPYLPAKTLEVINIPGGQKISAVQVSGAGTLYITAITRP